MIINPTKFSWTAPTLNTDGSAITEPLAYRLYVDGVANSDFPGTLNTDGKYEMLFADTAITDGAHVIYITAFYVDKPELESDPSGTLDVVLGLARPEAPLDFSAE